MCLLHPATCAVKEYLAAVFGVPARFNEVVAVDRFAVIPAGSFPEAMPQTYGVHPPFAWMTAEYGLPTIPLGKVVVMMVA
jgi:hypothetical protein